MPSKEYVSRFEMDPFLSAFDSDKAFASRHVMHPYSRRLRLMQWLPVSTHVCDSINTWSSCLERVLAHVGVMTSKVLDMSSMGVVMHFSEARFDCC